MDCERSTCLCGARSGSPQLLTQHWYEFVCVTIARATTSIQNFDFQTTFRTTPDLQTRFADYPRPSNSICRLPPTFKLDSQTPFDLQTRFTDSLRPSNSIRRLPSTFKLDSQTPSDLQTRFADSLRPSNSICRPSCSDFQTRFADLHTPTFELNWQSLRDY